MAKYALAKIPVIWIAVACFTVNLFTFINPSDSYAVTPERIEHQDEGKAKAYIKQIADAIAKEGKEPSHVVLEKELKRLPMLVEGAVGKSLGVEDKETARKIDRLLTLYNKFGELSGSVLVSKKGKVIFEKAYGFADLELDVPNDIDTKYKIGSVTKQFTSMLIMQMVAKGVISLDGAISDYLPEYPKRQGKRVTIHHLLTHTSGIPNYTALPDFDTKQRLHHEAKDVLSEFSSMKLEFEPGSRFQYSNSNYFILGVILERLSGKTYEELLQENIFTPLQMTDTGYDHSETILKKRAKGYALKCEGCVNASYIDMSVPFAAGALYSTVRDLKKWDDALYENKLISNKFKKIIFEPFLNAYAYGWGIYKLDLIQQKTSKTIHYHLGGINGFSAVISRFPEDEISIILLTNIERAEVGGIVVRIASLIYGESYELPKSIGDSTKIELNRMQPFLTLLGERVSAIIDLLVQVEPRQEVQDLRKEAKGLKRLTEYTPRGKLIDSLSEQKWRDWLEGIRAYTLIPTRRALTQLQVLLQTSEKFKKTQRQKILELLVESQTIIREYETEFNHSRSPKYRNVILIESPSKPADGKLLDAISQNINRGASIKRVSSAKEALKIYQEKEQKDSDTVVFIDSKVIKFNRVAGELKKLDQNITIIAALSRRDDVSRYSELIKTGTIDNIFLSPYLDKELVEIMAVQTIPIKGKSLGGEEAKAFIETYISDIPYNFDVSSILNRPTRPSLLFVDFKNLKNNFTNGERSQENEIYVMTNLNQKKRGGKLKVVIYNASLEDKLIEKYRALDNVFITQKNAELAFNEHAVQYKDFILHLSKDGVNPPNDFDKSQRNRISFFRYRSNETGVMAAALLFSEMSGNLPGVQKIGDYIVLAGEVLGDLLRAHENNFVLAQSA